MHGQATSLTKQLDNASRYLDKGKLANACKKLQDFINGVGKKTPNPLDTATAAGLRTLT